MKANMPDVPSVPFPGLAGGPGDGVPCHICGTRFSMGVRVCSWCGAELDVLSVPDDQIVRDRVILWSRNEEPIIPGDDAEELVSYKGESVNSDEKQDSVLTYVYLGISAVFMFCIVLVWPSVVGIITFVSLWVVTIVYTRLTADGGGYYDE